MKLHHKSHPERKREVVPPLPPIHLSMPPAFPPAAQPSPLYSSTAPFPPFVSVCRECPMDGPGVFYITPSCTSNAKQTHFYPGPSAFYLPLLPPAPLHPLACCKSINLQPDAMEEAGSPCLGSTSSTRGRQFFHRQNPLNLN